MFFATPQITNTNPIDSVEAIFKQKSFSFERRDLNEIVVEVQGKWNDMLLFFAWETHLKCLHMSCFMNIEAKICDKSRIFELLALINENLWIGHFSYWSEHETPIFKHSVIVDEDDFNFSGKLAQIIDIAINQCEQMYPVFQAVLAQNLPLKQVLFSTSQTLQ
ncbi:MAG: YbjN domain-containing protein [Alphaproteobacteria bacterium]|nr:YbjN domain-containing protein [Alphaproteobacteria bacterium]